MAYLIVYSVQITHELCLTSDTSYSLGTMSTQDHMMLSVLWFPLRARTTATNIDDLITTIHIIQTVYILCFNTAVLGTKCLSSPNFSNILTTLAHHSISNLDSHHITQAHNNAYSSFVIIYELTTSQNTRNNNYCIVGEPTRCCTYRSFGRQKFTELLKKPQSVGELLM